MKAPRFQYVRAQSRAETLELLARHAGEARILAGGQSLMPILNMRLASPSILIDINSLPDLAGITLHNGVVRIGAMTRHREVSESSLIQEHLPLLTDAMRHVAHPAIRNRGTFGGSLATADPSAEMPACCLALGGRMVAESTRGTRSIAADDFFHGIFETALESDELLTSVEFPIPGAAWKPCFIEFARRHGDFAIAGMAAQAQLDETRLSDIRLVLFGVGDRPIRVTAAEQALLGSAPGAKAIAAAQAAVSDRLSPMSDNHASAEMRLHYARVLIERTVRHLGVMEA